MAKTHQLTLSNIFGNRSQQIDHIQMLPEMHHNLQFGYKSAHHIVVGHLFDHFDRHHRLILVRQDALGGCSHHNAERAGAQLLVQLQLFARKLVLFVVRQQIGLFVESQVGIDALHVARFEVGQAGCF